MDITEALRLLHERTHELERLNRELEDTNRGVVALYAEMEARAEHLRQADEIKSTLLSNMSHEFRTPVNAILGLCDLLIEHRRRQQADVEPEVAFIRRAAEDLTRLIDDLLDLAKVKAGKTIVRPAPVDVGALFRALRGVIRPLLNEAVTVVFDEGDNLPTLLTDEAKVAQILRNLVSNALKYTERGEVRVSARREGPSHVRFAVTDTGIGIAPEDQTRVFEEFVQIENRLQKKVAGTGLGLPLSRRLAELLGGTLAVESVAGAGSTFTLTLPITILR